MQIKKIILATLTLATLCSCQDGSFNKQTAGTVIGGVGGALIGSQFGKGNGRLVGVAVGALGGAALGNMIGGNLDKEDAKYYGRANQSALEAAPDARTVEWKNPNSGNYGSFTPTRTVKENNRYCREYTNKVTVGGKTQEAYGKACRQPDGNWEIVQ